MFYARDVLLHNSKAILELYPFLFLFLLRKQTASTPGYIWLLPGTICTILGIVFERLSLVWMGSYWNALAFCNLAGLTFAWPATMLVFAVPPLTGFTSLFLGFKLRILVTEICGWILSFLDGATATSGNQVLFLQHWYSVDRVCEGMKMGSATFLIALILMRRTLFRGSLLIGGLALPLWFFVNLLRVILLIVFHVPAFTWQHELIGLVLFVCGILFPLIIISLWFARPDVQSNSHARTVAWPIFAIQVILLICLVQFKPAHPEGTYAWPSRILEFELDRGSLYPDPRIAVYRSGDNQMIVKHQLFGIGTGHDPRICFEGAGFVFHEKIQDSTDKAYAWINSGFVEKSGQRSALLWWYTIGKQRTSSDLEWRIARIRGQDVVQWNLYGARESDLRLIAERLAACDCLP